MEMSGDMPPELLENNAEHAYFMKQALMMVIVSCPSDTGDWYSYTRSREKKPLQPVKPRLAVFWCMTTRLLVLE